MFLFDADRTMQERISTKAWGYTLSREGVSGLEGQRLGFR